jgi:tripartite-type tricarboxylate transporter receptor subunit TctC
MRPTAIGRSVLLLFGMGLAATAQAETPAEFYKGRQLAFVIGFNPGGGYDLYARLVARHMPKHVPGQPAIVVRNMGGAGSLIAANYMGARAPTDGTEVGMIEGSVAIEPVISGTPAKFDTRAFYWLGSANMETGVCFIRNDAKHKTIADVLKDELVTGTAGGSTLVYPSAMNAVLGTKFKLVSGYKGSNGATLAFERGEIEAMCGNIYTPIRTTRPQWLAPGGIARVLVQMALTRHADLPDVPLAVDMAKDDEGKRVLRVIITSQSLLGRAFFLPPGVPADRAAALRKAFDATMVDKEFLADAKKMQADVEPQTGSEVEVLLNEVFTTPKPVLDRAAAILARK